MLAESGVAGDHGQQRWGVSSSESCNFNFVSCLNFFFVYECYEQIRRDYWACLGIMVACNRALPLNHPWRQCDISGLLSIIILLVGECLLNASVCGCSNHYHHPSKETEKAFLKTHIPPRRITALKWFQNHIHPTQVSDINTKKRKLGVEVNPTPSASFFSFY